MPLSWIKSASKLLKILHAIDYLNMSSLQLKQKKTFNSGNNAVYLSG